ncbi:hypothetical protein A2686_02995 [Candidatus Woesebacteria bacterium RIFCSPHIGHO2_01_FULL_38_10]|uniref:ATP-grasp domain-containing protein n=1 Tax=Candidatus Woesebacteria bacterium RIFCSPLOWO2_01_FULL_39_10b TaxID=1802517 RepID=A0A1F8BAW9_9BACT|nr:MAG: hypothetical protein A2686_02995 [Candidatus Woesebacteria bacterium RIFCSPHIGHO2_01_FULL_38_10]OGM60525.1 MAG: hypothetical protein A2892_00685 [Candidatus Woesebacteria bacterium RIFCSPLOWO2_01_FULL_39_10b]
MKILIVGKVTSGQTNRLKEEGGRRGHIVDNCSSYDLIIRTAKNFFKPAVGGLDLQKYNLIYLLTVGERKWEWYISCDYLHKNFGTKIVEFKMIDPAYKVYFTPTSELIKQIELGIRFPKTSIVLSIKTLREALKDFNFPVVIKNSYGQRGLGVSKVNSYKEIKRVILKDKASVSFQIREFIPNDGDIRVFTVGYRAIGAMKRTPSQGDFRSNISRGAKGESFDLNKNSDIREIAEKLSRINHTEIAGVDIMLHKKTHRAYVLEINRGPQFRGLEEFTGVNAALEIIKYFELLYESRTH